MTPTPEFLRRWSAERVMEYELYTPDFEDELDHSSYLIEGKKWISEADWVPDKDANQTDMVIERMRELGWFCKQLNNSTLDGKPQYSCEFFGDSPKRFCAVADNRHLATLLAAHKALEGKCLP